MIHSSLQVLIDHTDVIVGGTQGLIITRQRDGDNIVVLHIVDHFHAPPGASNDLFPLGQREGVLPHRRLALGGLFIQPDQRHKALLQRIHTLGIKLVLPDAVHHAQVGNEGHVLLGPICDVVFVCISQRLHVVVDLIAVDTIRTGQHHRRLLAGDVAEEIHITVPTAPQNIQRLVSVFLVVACAPHQL